MVAVSDGDTITVLDEMDKGNFKIRLDKIDAPEKKQARAYIKGLWTDPKPINPHDFRKKRRGKY